MWHLHDRTRQADAFPNVSHTGAAILKEFNLVVEPYRSFETSGVTAKASDEQLIVVPTLRPTTIPQMAYQDSMHGFRALITRLEL